jgi:3'(2'), 5'-bisphosphate nucleotidase
MNNKTLLHTAISAALKAGTAILKIYARDFEVEYKVDESPLTEADKVSHNIIVQHLADTGLPVLSEESKAAPYAERSQWDRFWLIDPIDGTKEFIKKNGEFTVNIALIEYGRPVLGVVYAPVLETLYCGQLDVERKRAEAWKSTDCEGKSLSEIMSSAMPLSTSHGSLSTEKNLRVVASRSHCGEETVSFIEQLEEKFGEAERVSKGSSLKLCMVADGSADIYPRIAPTMEWDTAAAQAVVEAAGGKVYEYNPTVPSTDYLSGNSLLTALHYNKENLLNPYFVVC